MAVVTHDDVVKVVLLNSKTASGDRNAILETGEENNVILNLKLISPAQGLMENFGDFSIEGKDPTEDNYANGCDVSVVALHRGGIITEAIKLALKEVFVILNKNKVKVDIVYVNEPSYTMTKLEITVLSLIIQNILRDFRSNATIWIETIKNDGVYSLSMEQSASTKKDKKKDKKDKDKKKKKKGKK